MKLVAELTKVRSFNLHSCLINQWFVLTFLLENKENLVKDTDDVLRIFVNWIHLYTDF